MIEFKKSGPFDPGYGEGKEVCLIGLGSAGVAVLDQMVLEGRWVKNMLCLDSDAQAIEGSVVPSKLMLGRRTLRGLGCRGDADLAAQLFDEDADEVRKLVRGMDVAVVVAGLGGGTGTGMALGLLDLLREEGASVVVVGMLPMECEGRMRGALSRKGVAAVKNKADAAFFLSNERIVAQVEMEGGIREAWKNHNSSIGTLCRGFCQMLGRMGHVQMDVEQLRNYAGQCAGLAGEMENGWLGHGEAFGEGGEVEAVNLALDGSMLDDGAVWKLADRLLVMVEAGTDLSISRYQKIMEHLEEEMEQEMDVTSAVLIHPELGADALAVTLLFTRSGEGDVVTTELETVAAEAGMETWEDADEQLKVKVENVKDSSEEWKGEREADGSANKEEKPAVGKKKAKPQKYFAEQSELPFNKKEFKGRFEKSNPTMWNGEDLDQPTYMRLGIRIRL